ncbi:hypothetical protein [Actinomycetospora lemnae]|uniref:Uncharacterized protein n=1 Tax=Actinomycetospora lemnae TaxID=3019891 RepID=A0ABT5SZ81_9PSEU|nr:hypothetical protein [Actinomycetospora sp. DW7H6]MDD7967426.1 hypothetical protein [Actinomycetospora sp. DW7H6]
MSSTKRRPSIGVLVGVLVAALVVLAIVLFLLAQNQAAPTSPQTNGMIALLAPALL